MTRPPSDRGIPAVVAHLCGALGAAVVLLFAAGLTIPPSDPFPNSRLAAFHTFFVGAAVGDDDRLPVDHTPDWMDRVRPGDVLFMSKGRVAWGRWTHVAMVVRAPEVGDDAPPGARWVTPGSLAILDSGIHYGMYLQPFEAFADWPRVVVRRVSEDTEVGESIAAHALTHLDRIFAGVTLGAAPYSNCTKSAVDALRAQGFDPGISGWWVPDELYRSGIWLDA